MTHRGRSHPGGESPMGRRLPPGTLDRGPRNAISAGMTTSPPAQPTDAPEPVDAPRWTIRLEHPLDLDQIHELHRSAFSRPHEAELVDAIRSSAAFVPELSLVAATEDGSVLGHVLISLIDLEPDADGDATAPRMPVLALAPIGVLPQHAGRGIGTGLMREALAMADERSEPMIAVLGPPAFYRRFGFVPAADHGVRSPYDEAGDAMQVRPRPGAEVVAGTLVYPPPFSAA
jgi:putative acetyltransferase